jgi:hypothetical protein
VTTTRIKAALAVACAIALLAWTQATVAWTVARFGIFDDDLLGGSISMIPLAALLATVVLLALPALAEGGRRVAIGVAGALGLVMVGATADNIAGAVRDGSVSPQGWLVALLSATLIGIVAALAWVVAREPLEMRRGR